MERTTSDTDLEVLAVKHLRAGHPIECTKDRVVANADAAVEVEVTRAGPIGVTKVAPIGSGEDREVGDVDGAIAVHVGQANIRRAKDRVSARTQGHLGRYMQVVPDRWLALDVRDPVG